MQRASLRVWLSALLILCCASAVFSSSHVSKEPLSIPLSLKNTKALRVLDIKSSIVHEDIGIRAKNIDDKPVKDYYFTFPAPAAERIASISAFLRQEPQTALTITPAGFDSQKKLQHYKVTFDKPLQPNEDIRFGVKVSYTHTLKPLPAKIPQVARQHLLFISNVYLFSAYHTEEMKTTLILPNANVVSYTGGHGIVTKTNNKVVYGPFQDIKPESFEKLSCHFENGKPILTVKDLRRDLEVSHWGGNLAVEERYELRHDGAELDEPFSRVKHQLSKMVHGQTNMLQELTFRLPFEARDVYYRDDIGNVSTSHFRNEKDKSVLEIQPRYPLFGGWNYTWFHGYNADLQHFVHYSKSSGKYILNVKFVENTNDMTLDKVQLRIVLPEGATNVEVDAPFEFKSVEHKKHFTNFDTTGRHLVILEKNNVIKEHEKFIQIMYEYPTVRLLQKPLAASAALFSLFVLSIIISKMTFSIGTKEKSSLKKD
ncbi:dolichyl-diphosphooligosaccharide--protein glycosyltransferase subunit 1 [Apophysomyces sp. BC1034]|nr:dolichyl-diphosphooligosaccharide--protein glycosyltransferase subunit 1 [Apophysomyces sp. BC1015]KAG0181425.1 dolichyl-diphosphooligosaccharide--protein glycosyltransferase subunit 1 [Apophysomyces sp. BC1021]KAG0194582.1 dolichyl-diphosphooligosaccharide--protein glycosyltransferase subunit 1 [Apophysomyces sp. BC1034]